MSKSLGRELARRLAEAEADADDAEDDEGDGGEKTGGSEDEQVDLVVTTHRRVKKRGTRTTGPPAPPTITHIEETTVVHDAQTQTLPVPTTDRNVQTDLSAVREDLLIGSKVIETQTPSLIEKEEEPKSEREQHEELAKNLGISLERLDAFVQAQKEAKRTPAPCPPPTMLVKQDPSFGSRRGYGGRWARLSSRMNAAAQAPSYFISVRSHSLARLILVGQPTYFFVSVQGIPERCTALRLASCRKHHFVCPVQHCCLLDRCPVWCLVPSPHPSPSRLAVPSFDIINRSGTLAAGQHIRISLGRRASFRKFRDPQCACEHNLSLDKRVSAILPLV